MISTSTEKEEELKVERLVKKSAAALLLEPSIGHRFNAISLRAPQKKEPGFAYSTHRWKKS
jgi:hypothetical protein